MRKRKDIHYIPIGLMDIKKRKFNPVLSDNGFDVCAACGEESTAIDTFTKFCEPCYKELCKDIKSITIHGRTNGK